MSYEEFVEELKKRNHGSAEHHVIPRSVQTREGVKSEDVVRCTHRSICGCIFSTIGRMVCIHEVVFGVYSEDTMK